ncbi:23S rRNA (adenine2503-C2)-methyltransferase [Verrucomicrobium sp. GAS474]|uniref:23S rRNA (adenine(2503)-C(2))-methyltransferase RlmN n=1 Tax=Verrucomicrobium sp. GAS474 TaxID=1882831 RepID=UPI00087A80FC|nr:23S rRNA (adenine(2503)-C(2))-methyltransferase RlmN [Verrucomicrobium sp. GAS474]SDU24247.1 23S rRNA (adenine2503-C2)-methyltransferase [Verrucomicrobium sp. GAS474]
MEYLLDHLPPAWDLGPGQPEYRRKQLVEWVFVKKASSFEAMSNLPAPMRAHLASRYSLTPMTAAKIQGSKDTTRKFLWKLERGDFIESVLIPANVDLFGERSARQTLCVSSQVGCAYGCKFCASGLDGWKRHLSPAEIVGQIIEAERVAESRIDNLVFMGMGEPMANYENLMQAIEMINSPWGLNIGARHITISTSGLVPQIGMLAAQPRQLRLAISLHGASDPVRSQIMPVNRKYPIAALLDACEDYAGKKSQFITFEYILIEGVNDAPEEAKLLARHARRVRAKVNLIPYNTVEGLPWKRPSDAVIEAFAAHLKGAGCTATVRHEKGHDIDAACGQLRLREIQSA